MRKISFIVIVVAAMVLAACAPAATPPPALTQALPTQPPVDHQATIDASVAATLAAQPTQAPPPTQPPAPTQPPVPTAAPPTAAPAPDGYSPALTGAIWQWVSTQSGDQVTAAADPNRYQVEFRVDGSLSIKADCNMVMGTYTVGENNSMTIQLGPSTLAACPPDSQADAFMVQIGSTASYSFSQGVLVLGLMDQKTSMIFHMLPVAILPTPAANTPTAVANTSVNVRSGPGENYTIYGVLQYGTQAQVVGKNTDGSWWALNMPLSPTGAGWVSGAYVTVSNANNVAVLPAPAVPATVAPVAPGPNDPQATVLQPVYVRQGPGEMYPAYGTAQPGQTALVIGKSQDSSYWVVRVDPKVIPAGFAWVQASLVQAKNTGDVPVVAAPAAPAGTVLPPPASNMPTATATTAVNLRSGPSTDYPVLGVAQAGQTTEITGVSQDGGWWQIRVPTSISPDGLAWVSGAYVVAYNTAGVPVVAAPPPPPPVVTPPPPNNNPTGTWVITTEPLNVRAGPGNEYPSYGKIPAGVPLQVTGKVDNWLSVLMPAVPGGIGWVSGNYVVPYTGAVATPYQ